MAGYTLQGLATKMGDWLGVDTTRLPTEIRYDILNLSQREIYRDNDLLTNDTYSEVTVVAGNQYGPYLFELASTLTEGSPWNARPYAVSFWKVGETIASRTFLTEVSPERLSVLFPDPTGSGDPSHFAIERGTIVLRPIPSVDITLRVEWSGVPEDLSTAAPANQNALTLYNWEPLFFLSMIKASKYLLEEARIPFWQEEYDKALAAMLREHQRMKTGARRPASSEPG